MSEQLEDLPALSRLETELLFKPLIRQAHVLTAPNQKIMIRVFNDAAKLVFYKQKQTNKLQLKLKEISQCLELVHFHHRYDKEIIVEKELGENFGGPFPVNSALDYYQQHVEGEVADLQGNLISIDEQGLDFLYERHNLQGQYLEPRGKRLPWIRHTLNTTREIYTGTENTHEQIYYISHYVIPIQPSERMHSYFMVIVRRRKDGSFGFLTAFPVDRRNQFLSKITKLKPLRNIFKESI